MPLFPRPQNEPIAFGDWDAAKFQRLERILTPRLQRIDGRGDLDTAAVARDWWVELYLTRGLQFDMVHPIYNLLFKPGCEFTRPAYTGPRLWSWQVNAVGNAYGQRAALANGGLFLLSGGMAHLPGAHIPPLCEFKRLTQWVVEYLEGRLKVRGL